MNAEDLLEAYAAGKRDFRKVDLSDEDLSLTNLSDISLSGWAMTTNHLKS